jgi:hypothetical protein
MPRVKLSTELKEALSALSDKEKDKLIFRILPSHSRLVDRLTFELLEAGQSQEDRREELQETIETWLSKGKKHYYSPGLLLRMIRDLSGQINRHVYATKDKYGEAWLNLYLLVRTLEIYGEEVKKASPARARTFSNYVVKRSLKILRLLSKMHPDLHLDFQENLEKLGELIGQNHQLMQTSIFHGLDVNWLIRGEVPEEF